MGNDTLANNSHEVVPANFSSNRQAKQNVLTDFYELRMTCELCQKSTLLMGTSKQRMQSADKSFTCNACHRSFIEKKRLEYKKLHESKKRTFSCSVCHKTLSGATSFKKHTLLHADKKFSCNICHKSFTHMSFLKKHMDFHSKVYKCTICSKIFRGESNWKNHYLTHHKHQQKLPCDVCGKLFYRSKLDEHMKIHEEKRFRCEICQKNFVSKTRLNRHNLTHSGERPFSCSACQKRFSDKSGLKYHEQTHIGKQCLCQVCGKWFSRLDNVRTHMLVHTGEKPFSCNVCGRRFTTNQSMKMHVSRIHDDEDEKS